MVDALAYAADGLYVFPLHSVRADGSCSCGRGDACKQRGKHPRTLHGFKDATRDPETIRGWWRAWPDAGVGMACGPSRRIVLDLDIDKDKNGEAAFAALRGLELEGVDLIASTPRGGRHLFYAMPPGEPVTSTQSKIAPGIDTRAMGGYVVLPSAASPGRNWLVGEPGDELSPPPAWLDALLPRDSTTREKSEHSAPQSSTGARSDSGIALALLPETVASIRSALVFICNDEREDWLKVGMALKSTGAQQQAYDLWVEWSRSTANSALYQGAPGDHPKFDAADQLRVWRSLSKFFADGTEITLGTLFWLARRHGWPSTSDTGAPIDTALDDSSLPTINVGGDLERMTREARAALARRTDLRIRDRRIERAILDDSGTVVSSRPIERGEMLGLLAESARWIKQEEDGSKHPVHPDKDVAAVLAAPHDWRDLIPPLDDGAALVRDWHDIAEDLEPPSLVDGVLPAGGLVVLAGHPNAGKSFLALDVALRLAHGMSEWLGAEIDAPASTLYLAAEGIGGLGRRFRAWRAAHASERPAAGHYVAVRDGVPDLAAADAAQALESIVETCADAHDGRVPDVVVVDTWSAALPGADENNPGAMSGAVAALGALRRRHGCATVVLHHVRKPASGAPPAPLSMHDVRGAGPLVGAADVVLLADEGRLVVGKSRDGVRGTVRGYTLAAIPTDRGDETSAFVVPAITVAPADAAAERDRLRAERDERRSAAKDAAAVRRRDELCEEAVEAVREHPGLSKREIIALLSGRRDDSLDAINLALASGRIVDRGTPTRGRLELPGVPADEGDSVCGESPIPPGNPGNGERPSRVFPGVPGGTDGNGREHLGTVDGRAEA